MSDDDEAPGPVVELMPRDFFDEIWDPTNTERLDHHGRDLVKLFDRLEAVEKVVALLTKPKVERIYPQNPWRNIAEARVLLAEQVEDGTISAETYDEAMANLAASERVLDAAARDAADVATLQGRPGS